MDDLNKTLSSNTTEKYLCANYNYNNKLPFFHFIFLVQISENTSKKKYVIELDTKRYAPVRWITNLRDRYL